MKTDVGAIRATSRAAAAALAAHHSAIAAALLDGARQADVAEAAGVSQSAISQAMKRRRSARIGSRLTIPVLAAHLKDNPQFSLNEVVRACAQFSTDFRALPDLADRQIALGAPEKIGVEHLDALVAGLADYEAWRVNISSPDWTLSSRYSMFPSWFAAPTDGLKAWVMRHTPPQFAVRGVFIDERDLESV
jgi:transcriptional regulator with XRE-family HTH domain